MEDTLCLIRIYKPYAVCNYITGYPISPDNSPLSGLISKAIGHQCISGDGMERNAKKASNSDF